jgi:hypothetical protein
MASKVDPDQLKEADPATLRAIAQLTGQRREVDDDLAAAVEAARAAGRSRSEIAAMLGVSEQAAQREYGPLRRADHAVSGCGRW